MLGPARSAADDGRIDVAIAELRADHLVRLGLLEGGDANQVLAGGRPGRRRVAGLRPVLLAPLAPSGRRVARGVDVALADLAPLDLVGIEQIGPAPAGERRGELPREVDRVADARVHSQAAR